MLLNPYRFASAASPLADILIASWDMQEQSTGTRSDSVSARDLTSVNSVNFAAGVGPGQYAAVIDSSISSYLTLGYADAVNLVPGSNDWTLEAWVYEPTGSTGPGIMSVGYYADADGGVFMGSPISNGQGNFRLGSASYISNGSFDYRDQWTHILLKADRTADQARVVVNGGELGFYSTPSLPGSIGMKSARILAIGGYGYGGHTGADFRVGPVRIYNGLTDSTMDEWLYNGGTAARLHSDVIGYSG